MSRSKAIKNAHKAVLMDIAFYWLEEHDEIEEDQDDVFYALWDDRNVQRDSKDFVSDVMDVLDSIFLS